MKRQPRYRTDPCPITGAVSGAVGHRVSTGSWDGAGQAALEGAADGYMTGAITGAISGGVSSNACFVAGTQILSAVGLVNIEDIDAGDWVWAENPETGEKALKQVVQTFVRETNELVQVFVNDEEIVTTPNHPFYVPQKGWVGSIQLRAGDVLLLQNGEYVIVEKVQHEILEEPITVYNFEVEDFHTYYVGYCSILVHNANCQKGLGGKGWQGDSTWRSNLDTFKSQRDIRSINGNVLSVQDAQRAISSIGGKILRGPEISQTGTHTYWHLHYMYNGIKHTIEVIYGE